MKDNTKLNKIVKISLLLILMSTLCLFLFSCGPKGVIINIFHPGEMIYDNAKFESNSFDETQMCYIYTLKFTPENNEILGDILKILSIELLYSDENYSAGDSFANNLVYGENYQISVDEFNVVNSNSFELTMNVEYKIDILIYVEDTYFDTESINFDLVQQIINIELNRVVIMLEVVNPLLREI
ncbi:MAG: hypothetical protein KKH01_10225 [Firmicutes bacterium]|nr:hypothetical protein [Bacillota bacterium]